MKHYKELFNQTLENSRHIKTNLKFMETYQQLIVKNFEHFLVERCFTWMSPRWVLCKPSLPRLEKAEPQKNQPIFLEIFLK